MNHLAELAFHVTQFWYFVCFLYYPWYSSTQPILLILICFNLCTYRYVIAMSFITDFGSLCCYTTIIEDVLFVVINYRLLFMSSKGLSFLSTACLYVIATHLSTNVSSPHRHKHLCRLYFCCQSATHWAFLDLSCTTLPLLGIVTPFIQRRWFLSVATTRS